MAARGKDETQGFLSRWSQRKRAAEEAAEEATATPSEAQAPDGGDAPAVELTELPDIDTLDAGADFTVFMRKGVPEELKRRALRKLWQVDPAFHHICMLDDYNLDYTDAATVVPNLKTIYQVGRGMVLPEELAAEASRAQIAEGEPDGPLEPPAAAIGEGEAAPVESEEKAAVPEPRVARKPGTPLVPPSNRRTAEADGGQRAQDGSAGQPAPPSARRRRWGDADS